MLLSIEQRRKRLFHLPKMKDSKGRKNASGSKDKGDVRFELYGKAMVEKTVGSSGKTGRIYVPPEWIGHQVVIIKVD